MAENEVSQKIEELQFQEQTIQSLLMQKQSIELELNEVMNAIEELKNSDDEVYKIVSGIMLKVKKPQVQKDLEEKRKIIDLRLSSIEKQQKLVEERISSLRKEVNSTVGKNKK